MKILDNFLRGLTIKELRALDGLNKVNMITNRKSYGGVISVLSRKRIDGEPLLVQVCRDDNRKVWKLNEKIMPIDEFQNHIEKIIQDYQKVAEK